MDTSKEYWKQWSKITRLYQEEVGGRNFGFQEAMNFAEDYAKHKLKEYIRKASETFDSADELIESLCEVYIMVGVTATIPPQDEIISISHTEPTEEEIAHEGSTGGYDHVYCTKHNLK